MPVTTQDQPAELESCGNFKVLPLTMTLTTSEGNLQTHCTSSTPTTTESPIHQLFIRPHSSRKDSFPADRTLFVVNVPVDATQSHFDRLFRHCGVIERIEWKPLVSGSSCHIIFVDVESVPLVMEMKQRQRIWITATPQSTGLQKYLLKFKQSRPALDELKMRVDTFMAEFEQMEARIRDEEELKRNMPDEDGFVTVMRRGKYHPLTKEIKH
jgi:ribosomal RNA-processing protein 7